MKICQNCGAEVSDTAKFCRKCGSKVEAATVNAEQDEQAAQNMPESESVGSVEQRFSGAADPGSDSSADSRFSSDTDPESGGFEGSSYDEAYADQGFDANQSFGQGAGSAEYVGADYQWGPPTGGENYDEPAMPAVFIGGAEQEEPKKEEAPKEPYTYQIDAPSFDHTDEFDPKDISNNKVTAMAAYVLGPLGVIIALLAGQDSPYADFHMRQGLKFVVVEALLVIISLLLCWTLIVPAAATIFMIILWVVKIITFISVCKGRAVEPAIIRSMGFMK